MKHKTCTKCKQELQINKHNFYTKESEWGTGVVIFFASCKVCMRKSQMIRDKANKKYREEYNLKYMA